MARFDKLKKQKEAYLFTTPGNIVLALVVVFPILYSLYLSFCNMNIGHYANYSFVGLKNYARIFSTTDSDFVYVLIRTVIWTVVNIVLIVVIAFFLAMILNTKNLAFKGIYRTIMILPWAVPSYISALVWKGMFNYDFGAINKLLGMLGIGKINWLTDGTNAFIACVIVNLWMSIPFMMIIILGGLQSIDQNLYEAAEIDGANWINKVRNVTLPMLWPVVFPAIVLTTFVTFKQFDIIYLITQGLGGRTELILTYAYNTYKGFNYSLSAAYSMVIFLILIIFTLINMKLTKGGDV